MATHGRFLTTHVGSLPRPDDLKEMMWAREDGTSVDTAALEERVRQGVDEAVARQTKAGIDIVNDGEWGKPSYATYIKDRLNGFGGTATTTYVFEDIEALPQTKARVAADPGRKHRKAPACNAPISVRDMEAPRTDADRLKKALKVHGAAGGFLTAASPGVTAFFFHNDYYRTHEDYVFAIAEAMRHEYETIAAAGVTLQVDCPDLAMGRHTQFRELDLAGFRERMELNVEALNRALVNIPAGQVRMHLCWGNYPGPHHFDVPLQDIVDVVWKAKPHAIQFEAANPRHGHEWVVFETVKVPEGKVLIPGVIECQSNYIEHPELVAQRLVRYAKLVGRENVMAGTDCGLGPRVGHANIAWAKLEAMAQGARLASRQLWPRRAKPAKLVRKKRRTRRR